MWIQANTEEESFEVWEKMDSPDRKLPFLTGSPRIRTLRIGTSSRRKIVLSSSISIIKDNNSPCDIWYFMAFNFPFEETISVLHFLGNVEEITEETRSSLYSVTRLLQCIYVSNTFLYLDKIISRLIYVFFLIMSALNNNNNVWYLMVA